MWKRSSRRRGGADFLYLAARARVALALVPQSGHNSAHDTRSRGILRSLEPLGARGQRGVGRGVLGDGAGGRVRGAEAARGVAGGAGRCAARGAPRHLALHGAWLVAPGEAYRGAAPRVEVAPAARGARRGDGRARGTLRLGATIRQRRAVRHQRLVLESPDRALSRLCDGSGACGAAALSRREPGGGDPARRAAFHRAGEDARENEQRSPCAMTTPASIVTVSGLSKTYASGLEALKRIDLTIHRGEIFALLGPNGAGKTTLINIICGIVTPSEGTVLADGHDIVRDYRGARSKIGLVPQELHTDAFENVWATVRFSRGLFGRAPDPAHCEKVLRDLSLWDKKDSKIMTLSGGMKRRVMIAKALSHEPQILFLDEPTAGVDVELRRDMWQMVRRLRESGVTIILTTHYIEEAEEMADRIGVINKGELIVVEDKSLLMRKLGKKQLTLQLQNRLAQIPPGLSAYPLELADDGHALVFTFDAQSKETGIATLLKRLGDLDINFKDLHSSESSLEEIFVNLVRTRT